MSLPKSIYNKYPYLEEDTIIVGYRGSIAHEMYVPNTNKDSIDDKDVMAIVIPEIDNYFGLKEKEWGSRGTMEHFIDEWDIVSYEFKKYMELLVKCNPNVMSLLWLKDGYYIKLNDMGKLLIENRDLFSSKIAYHTFSGYAHDQLDRMEKRKTKGYTGEKRKQLVNKFGFDTKNAAHLTRLLRMGIEFLNEGILHVAREDSSQLLEIKKGKWSLEQVKKESDRLFKRLKIAYDNSKLPAKPDYNKINKFTVELLSNYFKTKS
jgi:predicted nucleotidyltransferase